MKKKTTTTMLTIHEVKKKIGKMPTIIYPVGRETHPFPSRKPTQLRTVSFSDKYQASLQRFLSFLSHHSHNR